MHVQSVAVIGEKIIDLTLKADGGVQVSLVKGAVENGVFVPIEGTARHIQIDASTVSNVLDLPSDGVKTRRQDIGESIYGYLLTAGIIAGTLVS